MNLLSLLTVLFTALKLTHVITWSWWLVLSPSILHGVLCAAIVVRLEANSTRRY